MRVHSWNPFCFALEAVLRSFLILCLSLYAAPIALSGSKPALNWEYVNTTLSEESPHERN